MASLRRDLGDNLPDQVRAAADAQLTGSGETVLGHMTDGYIDRAKSRGASYFDLDDDLWGSLTTVQQKAANKRVLDAAIANGDVITLATREANIRDGSDLRWEVDYLTINTDAYRWDGDARLVPK